MEVLIACEESQEVCKAFRKLGHNAYSCDLQDCSGGHAEWHIKDDAIKIMNKQNWDLVVAHPTCTRLANSGVRWLRERNLWDDLHKAVYFFNQFIKYGQSGNKIAIENPIQHKHAKKLLLAPYSQIIQPYQFGHPESKATCLWLFKLPRLQPTNNIYNEMMKLPIKDRQRIWWMGGGKEKIRSKTYKGIAEAMADQWTKPYIKPFF